MSSVFYYAPAVIGKKIKAPPLKAELGIAHLHNGIVCVCEKFFVDHGLGAARI